MSAFNNDNARDLRRDLRRDIPRPEPAAADEALDAVPEVIVPPGTINGMDWGHHLQHEFTAPQVIPLYDIVLDQCGLIAEAPSGYRWRQQTSGMLCTQRELEGIFVPIPDGEVALDLVRLHPGCSVDTLDDRQQDSAYRAAHPDEVAQAAAWTREHYPALEAIHEAWAKAPAGLTEEEAEEIDRVLQRAQLPLTVDRSRLERSAEAWVWVRVADAVDTWQHELITFAPADKPRTPYRYQRNPAGYRFAWMFAALAGKQAILTWQNCD